MNEKDEAHYFKVDVNKPKVWSQMFFDDGGVTQGKYIPVDIYFNEDAIEKLATGFLTETNRTTGVLFIWGAGKVYVKLAELLLLEGSQTLRLLDL